MITSRKRLDIETQLFNTQYENCNPIPLIQSTIQHTLSIMVQLCSCFARFLTMIHNSKIFMTYICLAIVAFLLLHRHHEHIAIMSSMFVVVSILENSIIIDEFNVKFHTKITCIIDALHVRVFNNFITSIQTPSDRVKVLVEITIVLNESIAKDYLVNLTKDVNVLTSIL